MLDMTLKDLKTEDDKIAFFKNIYDYCEAHNWDVDKTNEFGISLDMSGESVRRYGKLYIREYMGLSDEEISSKIEQINKVIKKSISNHFLATISNPNALLDEPKNDSYQLWNNEDEKKMFLEYIYQYCESTKYLSRKADEIGRQLGIGLYPKIFKLAEMYATEYLKIQPDAYKKHKSELVKQARLVLYAESSGSNTLYNALLNATSVEEEIKLLEESEFNISYLMDHAQSWQITYNRQDDYQRLMDKLTNYANSKKEEQEHLKAQIREENKNSKIEEATNLISSFIEADSFSIKVFCDELNIDKKDFDKCLSIVEEKNPELFSIYTAKINKMKSTRYAILLGNIKKLISQMKNGIPLEDGTIRPFDIIDYFLTTKLSFDEILKTTKKALSIDEMKTFRSFTIRNKPSKIWNNNDIEKCYESVHIVGATFDENREIVNPGHEVTLEEKKNAIDYLRKLNVPLCENTYRCALRRYLSGYLTFGEETNKIAIKKNS